MYYTWVLMPEIMHYNASIYNPLTDETEHFKCRPTPEGLVRSLKKKNLEARQVKICYGAKLSRL